jgi:hypothetical protein
MVDSLVLTRVRFHVLSPFSLDKSEDLRYIPSAWGSEVGVPPSPRIWFKMTTKRSRAEDMGTKDLVNFPLAWAREKSTRVAMQTILLKQKRREELGERKKHFRSS